MCGCQVKLKVSVLHNPGGMVTAADFLKDVEASLVVEKLPPQLRQLHLSRTSPSGTLMTHIAGHVILIIAGV